MSQRDTTLCIGKWPELTKVSTNNRKQCTRVYEVCSYDFVHWRMGARIWQDLRHNLLLYPLFLKLIKTSSWYSSLRCVQIPKTVKCCSRCIEGWTHVNIPMFITKKTLMEKKMIQDLFWKLIIPVLLDFLCTYETIQKNLWRSTI